MKKLLLIILLWTLPCRATNYYVDQPSGTGSKNGSDWDNAWADLDNTDSQLSAGDTVFVKGTDTDTWSPANLIGTASNYIIIVSKDIYDSGGLSMTTTDTTNTWSVNSGGINTNNTCITFSTGTNRYVKVIGFRIALSDNQWVSLDESNKCIWFQKCRFTDCDNYGILNEGCDSMFVTNCVFDTLNCSGGSDIYVNDPTPYNIFIYNNTFRRGSGCANNDFIRIQNSHNIDIRNNIFGASFNESNPLSLIAIGYTDEFNGTLTIDYNVHYYDVGLAGNNVILYFNTNIDKDNYTVWADSCQVYGASNCTNSQFFLDSTNPTYKTRYFATRPTNLIAGVNLGFGGWIGWDQSTPFSQLKPRILISK